MTGTPLTIGMMPSHPGAIMREEICTASDYSTRKAHALTVSTTIRISVHNITKTQPTIS